MTIVDVVNGSNHPLRFVHGKPVCQSDDPMTRVSDDIEKYVSFRHDELSTAAELCNPGTICKTKVLALRDKALTQLDRSITLLHLLTNSKWEGVQQSIRFLSLLPMSSVKDPSPHGSRAHSTLDVLIGNTSYLLDICKLRNRRTCEFVELLEQLKVGGSWVIEDRSNTVAVDLLPLSTIIVSESPYVVFVMPPSDYFPSTRLIAPTSGLLGKCVKEKLRLKLSVSSVSFSSSFLSTRSADCGSIGLPTDQSRNFNEVLSEMQLICLDHAIFCFIRKECEKKLHSTRFPYKNASGRSGCWFLQEDVIFPELCDCLSLVWMESVIESSEVQNAPPPILTISVDRHENEGHLVGLVSHMRRLFINRKNDKNFSLLDEIFQKIY